MHIRYLTAGESHGKALVSIIEGIPKGLRLEAGFINRELRRRMAGYGRGKRMRIEKDRVEILSGVRKKKTLGSPIALLIKNKDFKIDILHAVNSPRPGHADLAGALKFGERDMRNILERASARETASRVATGAVAKILLGRFGIKLISRVIMIGGVRSDEKLMRLEIKKARAEGDTLGGTFEVIAKGVPAGLGSYAQWDRRLDANLARQVMSIPGIKGVEIGLGFFMAESRGSFVHDEISFNRKSASFRRSSNNAGGIEGGISNGEDIVLRAAMKPIATLGKPLNSVNMKSKRPAKAAVERADICVVPSAAVIAESVSAIEIARAFCEKFGGDSLAEMRRNYEGYIKQVRKI
jgi:chorismate synthase